MITDAAANVHLRGQTTKLLMFYAKQLTGFRPALELIGKKTGISKNKIWEIRKKLIDHGLIAYAPADYILIDWRRIRAFAALEKPLRLPQGKAYTFFPVRKPTKTEPTIGQIGSQYKIKNLRPLTATEKHFYSAVDQLRESELIDLMNCLPGPGLSKNGGT